MEKTKDYEMLAENLCDIHFLYSKDLSNVFEQHSTRGEEAALFWLSKLETPVSAGELASKLGITSGRIANILSSLDRKNTSNATVPQGIAGRSMLPSRRPAPIISGTSMRRPKRAT